MKCVLKLKNNLKSDGPNKKRDNSHPIGSLSG